MIKFHIIDSDDPLKEGTKLTAICGKDIPETVFVFYFDTTALDFVASIDPLKTCRHCMDVEVNRRYVYGIVSGEEFLNSIRKRDEVAA